MVGDKDRSADHSKSSDTSDPEASRKKTSPADIGMADTTTLGAGVVAPRIIDEPESSSPSTDRDETIHAAARQTLPGSDSSTAVLDNQELRPLEFQRIEPSIARGETVRLDPERRRVRVGRSLDNDFRLYSASTSRAHALIEGTTSGDWILTPLPGKQFKVDGVSTGDAVVIQPGMNLVFGGDHLRCVEAGPNPVKVDGDARQSKARPAWITQPRRAYVAVAVLLSIVGAILLFSSE